MRRLPPLRGCPCRHDLFWENTRGPHCDGLCRGADGGGAVASWRTTAPDGGGTQRPSGDAGGAGQPFAEAMRDADLAVPDGVSIVMASRVLDLPIPERVTGGDLMERMCAEAARYGLRVFFLEGSPGAAVMAAHHLRKRYPGLEICGMYCPPLGFEKDEAEGARILKAIAEAAPDLLCVAFGAPKQEIWMQENRAQLNVGAILAVGAALDTQAGLRRRAPQWVQHIALEWLFRLLMEPRRFWRRYLIGNTVRAAGDAARKLDRLWRSIRQRAQRKPPTSRRRSD